MRKQKVKLTKIADITKMNISNLLHQNQNQNKNYFSKKELNIKTS